MTKSRLGGRGTCVDLLKEVFKTDRIIAYIFSTFNPGLQVFHALLTWYYTGLFKLPVMNCPKKDTFPLK